MGLLSDLIGNVIAMTPIIIGGSGLVLVAMIIAFVFFEFIEAFTEFRRELDDADGVDKVFEILEAVVHFMINIINIPVQLFETLIDNVNNIGDIFNCIWDLFRMALELFTEYYSVLVIMGLLSPLYLGLYYIGDVIDALID